MLNFRYETVGRNKDIVAVVLSGTLDQDNCEYLLDCVKDEILDGRKKVILDCNELSFISSMGLGTLVRVNSRMKKIDGEVKLACVHGAVAQVIKIVGFNKLFEIYNTVGEAVAAHGG